MVARDEFAYVDELWRRWSPAWKDIPAAETERVKAAFREPGCAEAACSYYRFITPRVAEIRDAAGGRVTALAESDPRRIEFNRLHGLSSAVMLVTILAAAGLLYAEVRDGS